MKYRFIFYFLIFTNFAYSININVDTLKNIKITERTSPYFFQNKKSVYNISSNILPGNPDKYIMSINQDKNGCLWIGSYGGGLYIYNGETIKNLLLTKYNQITCIVKDANENIWIGSTEGIILFDGYDFIKYDFGSYNLNFINQLKIFNNKLIAVTDDGIIQFTKNNWEFFLKGKHIKDIEKYDDKYLICESNKIAVISEKFKIINEYKFPEIKRINDLFITDTAFLAATNDGLLYLNKINFTHRQLLFGYDIKEIKVNENKLFLATNKGLIIKQGGETEVLNTENGLSTNEIRTIFIDRQGIVWVGSKNLHLQKLVLNLKIFNNENWLPYCFETDDNGNLFVGTDLGIIFKFNGIDFKKYYEFNHRDPIFIDNMFMNDVYEKIRDIAFLSKDSMLVSTRKGLYLFMNNKKVKLINDSIPRTKIFVSNKKIYLGFSYYYNRDFSQFNINKFQFPEKHSPLFFQFFDNKENIWLTLSDSSLYIFDGKKLKTVVDTLKITAISKNKYGKIIFSSVDGDVYKFINNKAKKIFSLPKNYNDIKKIIFYENKYIIVLTDKILLVEIDKNKKIKILCNPLFSKFYMDKFYSKIRMDKDNNVWLFSGLTDTKIVNFNINSCVKLFQKPILSISKLELFYEEIDWKKLNIKPKQVLKKRGYSFNGLTDYSILPKNLILNYNKNYLSFYFNCVDFYNNDIEYFVKLDGLEKKWTNIKQKNFINYTSLVHGKYKLQVYAKSKISNIKSNIISFPFTILPPWWQTWWFRTIEILLILLLLYFIYKWRVSSLIKRQKQLEQKVKQRTAEIEQQKEEISTQRDDIENKNEELNQLVEEITTQKEEIETQRDFVQKQKNEIENVHKEVSQSIDYAQRIQNSILPELKILKQNFDDYFVLLKPKDVVSGDFYWWTNIEDHTVITAVDCTGHGVPGAFMSMLGASFLREIVEKEYITHTGVILRKLRKEIIKSLKQKGESGEQKDGMDMAIISIDNKTNVMQFSGANNPVYIVRNSIANEEQSVLEIGNQTISNNNEQIELFTPLINNNGYELYEIKSDKMPIAIYQRMDKFKTHEIQLQKGDIVYMFSDGYADQFGGEKGKKFKYKPFKQLLLDNADKPMKMQKEILNNTFEVWKGSLEQIDDVVVLGIKI